VIANVRPTRLALLVLGLALTGCETRTEDTSTASPSPSPSPAATAPETAANTATPAPAAPEAKPEPIVSEAKPEPVAAASNGGIKLEKVNYDELRKRIAADKDAKFTLVDCWATWCAPCKENFPHVVQMKKKYGDKGVRVIALSFDDPTNAKQVEEAEAFLNEQKADTTNYLIDEAEGVPYEKFNTNTIPAVFLYGPDGKEIKRFTMDDPNNQFTYDEVEKTVEDLLAGKPLPKS
jgi:thiol-disulfide isomerase/thioredoxin